MPSNQPEPVKADWIVSLLGRVKALEVNPHEEALTSILSYKVIASPTINQEASQNLALMLKN
ncbi:hypothetical protein [Nostoc flagelliforme]|uniref:hypothetical protein n=1 Tax=Nostoc flagelliforme TaxID=1306274 RepID=UPI000C2D279D